MAVLIWVLADEAEEALMRDAQQLGRRLRKAVNHHLMPFARKAQAVPHACVLCLDRCGRLRSRRERAAEAGDRVTDTQRGVENAADGDRAKQAMAGNGVDAGGGDASAVRAIGIAAEMTR